MYKQKETERINLLAKKMQDGTITPEEKQEFERWYASFNDSYIEINSDENLEDLEHRIYTNIIAKAHIKPLRKTVLLWKIASSAAAVILIFFGIYYFNHTDTPEIAYTKKHIATDITHGENKAILTLADGSVISLDSANNGKIAKQSGIEITKTADGQLVYTTSEKSSDLASNSLLFNTVSTPRGGQYQIVLPDGTHVWLNASSSLKYPTSFKGSERKVELEGEAYFEVVSNKKMPFRVLSKNQLVEVLGTHFNINSYADENVTKTTLLEGSVKIARLSGAQKSLSDYKILIPGQQAVLAEKIKVSNVDTEEAVAWKNGELMFSSQEIKGVMRQISRWYDVDIIYEDNIDDIILSGSISKYANVSKVLEILELTGNIHFKIEGRRILVMHK